MRSDNRLLGRWGEDIACEWLKKQGYKILGRNYACRFGELDIIAEKKKTLVFAEVKLRRDDRFAPAAEFVTATKQERLRLTAELYLQHNPYRGAVRFDVLEVYAPLGLDTRNPQVRQIEGAFE